MPYGASVCKVTSQFQPRTHEHFPRINCLPPPEITPHHQVNLKKTSVKNFVNKVRPNLNVKKRANYIKGGSELPQDSERGSILAESQISQSPEVQSDWRKEYSMVHGTDNPRRLCNLD